MLKILLFIITFIAFGGMQSFAINYGGSTISFPEMYSSGSVHIGDAVTSSIYLGWYRDDTFDGGNGRLQKWFSCRDITPPYTESINPFLVVGDSQFYLTGGYIDMYIYVDSVMTNSGHITRYLSGETTSGTYSENYAFCINVDTIQLFSDAGGLFAGRYIYSYNYWLYNSSGGLIMNDKFFFTGATSLGIRTNSDMDMGSSIRSGAGQDPYPWAYNFIDFLAYPSYDATAWKEKGAERQKYLSSFLTGTTEIYNDIRYPAGWFYGSTGYIDLQLPNTGGETPIDYFEECISFLDVGCYLEGVWNAFKDWILPDYSINWNGETFNCVMGGTGGIYSGSTAGNQSISLVQRFANIVSIVNPLPPPEGSEVCLFSGEKETVDYGNGGVNIFDMFLVLATLVPIIFFTHHKKGSE